MNKKLLVLIVFIFSAGLLQSQTINLRLSTYFYSWQRIDSLSDNSTAKTTHLQGYQNLLFDFNTDKWSFNTLAQTEEDVIHKIGDGFNYRIYNAYIKGTNLFNMIDVKIGRQYLFAGVGKGTVDGINLKVKAGKNKEYQVAVYGGALTPYTYDFKNYPTVKKNYRFGGQFTYYGVRDLTVGVSYTNSRKEPEAYVTTRLDSLYNTSTRTIAFDSQADQLAGIDFNYTYKQVHSVFGKAYFDVYRKKFYKGEFNVSALVSTNLRAFADYLYSEPQIAFNSIFWVFEHQKTQEISGGLSYTLKNGMNLFAKAGSVIYKNTVTTDNAPKNYSIRIEGGLAHTMYGLTFVKYLGYAGSSDGVNAYYNREIFKSKFTVTSSLGYARYRIGDYTTDASGATIDKVNSFSGILGINYRPIPQFSIDAQGQFMFNRIYKSDARFLIGVNYWLFKKL